MCVGHVETWIDVDEERLVGFSAPFDDSVLENWAFAAKPAHPLVLAWKAEFARAIVMGFDAYKAECSTSGRGSQATLERMPYLTMHGAYVVVHDPMRVFLRRSCCPEFGPYHFICDSWDNETAALARLFWSPTPHPPLMKINGHHRTILERLSLILPVLPGSFLDRVLCYRSTPIVTYLVTLVTLVAVVKLVFWTDDGKGNSIGTSAITETITEGSS